MPFFSEISTFAPDLIFFPWLMSSTYLQAADLKIYALPLLVIFHSASVPLPAFSLTFAPFLVLVIVRYFFRLLL